MHNSALVPEVQVKESVEQSSMEGPRVPDGMDPLLMSSIVVALNSAVLGQLLLSIQKCHTVGFHRPLVCLQDEVQT